MKVRKGIDLQKPPVLKEEKSNKSSDSEYSKSSKPKKSEKLEKFEKPENSEDFEDRIKICSKCRGTGIDPFRTYRKCSQCNGKCYEIDRD